MFEVLDIIELRASLLELLRYLVYKLPVYCTHMYPCYPVQWIYHEPRQGRRHLGFIHRTVLIQ